MKRVTLTSRVLGVIKGGDEGKLTKFEGKLEKFINKQKKERADAIETLNDKIEDAKEKLKEIVENVNTERIKTEGGIDYVPTYVKAIINQNQVIKNYENSIEDLLEEIAEFDDVEDAIYNYEMVVTPTVK